MFAIELTVENLDKIREEVNLTRDQLNNLYRSIKLGPHYFVRGYVMRTGQVLPWTFLPEFVVNNGFEYNPVVIKTDWDQIIRKENR